MKFRSTPRTTQTKYTCFLTDQNHITSQYKVEKQIQTPSTSGSF